MGLSGDQSIRIVCWAGSVRKIPWFVNFCWDRFCWFQSHQIRLCWSVALFREFGGLGVFVRGAQKKKTKCLHKHFPKKTPKSQPNFGLFFFWKVLVQTLFLGATAKNAKISNFSKKCVYNKCFWGHVHVTDVVV